MVVCISITYRECFQIWESWYHIYFSAYLLHEVTSFFPTGSLNPTEHWLSTKLLKLIPILTPARCPTLGVPLPKLFNWKYWSHHSSKTSKKKTSVSTSDIPLPFHAPIQVFPFLNSGGSRTTPSLTISHITSRKFYNIMKVKLTSLCIIPSSLTWGN